MMHAVPFVAFLLGLAAASPLEPLGRLDHPAIREASGIVQSRRHPGVFWVHNDSGNPPALFAVRRDGALVREFAVKALNVDWEDVAVDDRGRLYLGDTGNNHLLLPWRAVYRLDEPDPEKAADGPLPVATASYYQFPPGKRFDSEGFYVEGGRVVLIAKTHDRREAELFAIPFDPPAPLTRPALPEPAGKLPDFTEPVTGAALAPDGRRLAVCSYGVARVYDRARPGPWKRVATVRYKADGVEAICWDGPDLILAGEGRGLYRIAEHVWRGGTPPRPIPTVRPAPRSGATP